MSEGAGAERDPPLPPQPAEAVSIGAHDGLYLSGALEPPGLPGSIGTLTDFTIARQIGAGGMGIVFEAYHTAGGNRVAIKLLRPELTASPQAVHRFLVEAGHMHRLTHPHILKVTQVVERPLGPFYVMPFAEGGSLASHLQPGKPLGLETVVEVARQMGSALAYAHGKGIIHRDLKPANILLDAAGLALLCDFGLVRTVFNDSMTDAGDTQREGTAPYMSPAVAAGEAEDTRCDIYSFGALLYEMLAGKPPYEGRSVDAILRQVRAGPPTPLAALDLAIPKPLVTITEGCMARELRDRYAAMADVLIDLERFDRGRLPLGPRGRDTRQRWHRRRYAGIAALLLLIGGGALALLPAWRGGGVQRVISWAASRVSAPATAPAAAPAWTATTAAATPATPTTAAAATRAAPSVIAARLKGLDAATTELILDDAALADDDLAAIEPLSKLRVLTLSGSRLTDAGLSHLAGLKELHRLKLQRTGVTGTGLAHLHQLDRLRHLSLVQNPIDDAGLAHLPPLAELRYIYLGETKVTDRGLARLREMKQLSVLDLGWCAVTDAGLEQVEGLTQLTSLGLIGAKGVTDLGLKHLQSMTRLVNLDLRFATVTGEGLRHLAPASRLRDLSLGDTPFDDAGAENLRAFKALKRLLLAHTRVSDAGLVAVGKLTGLTELSLNRTGVSDIGLPHLAYLPQLTILDLSETAVTDAGMEHIATLPMLTDLRLSHTQVTGAGLRQLGSLPNLRTLVIGDMKITDADLAEIQTLPELTLLNISDTRVTDEGVRSLQRAMPALTIVR